MSAVSVNFVIMRAAVYRYLDTKSCLDEHSARCREPHGSRPLLGAHSTSLRRRRRWVHDHSHLSRVLPKTRKELLAVTAVELHARARDQRSPGPSILLRGRCVTARNCFLALYMVRADRMDGPRAKVVARARQTPYLFDTGGARSLRVQNAGPHQFRTRSIHASRRMSVNGGIMAHRMKLSFCHHYLIITYTGCEINLKYENEASTEVWVW